MTAAEERRARRRFASERREGRQAHAQAKRLLRMGGSQKPTIVALSRKNGARPVERTAHRLSTAHFQAAYPAMAEAGLGSMGVYIGQDQHGGSFVFDPWWLYEMGLLMDANTVILGMLRNGKSSLIKSYLWRQLVFGRLPEVLDPKGEYDPLIAKMGGVTLTLRPGGGLRINPISRAIARQGSVAALDDLARRQGVLSGVAQSVLERPLSPVEAIALAMALQVADDRQDGAEVDVTHVIDELRSPSKEMLAMLAMDKTQAQNGTRDVMLSLEQLRTGAMAGMFDGPTEGAGDNVWDSPALSVNLSALKAGSGGSDRALAIAMLATGSVLDAKRIERAQAARARGRAIDKTIRVNDEFWRALAIYGIGEQERASFKLSRSSGVQYVRAMHRLSDLDSAGDDGTRVQALAQGLATDCSTFIIYRQRKKDALRTAEHLELSPTEASLITKLQQGQALWRVGSSTFLVNHVRSEIEIPLVDTDEAMLNVNPGDPGYDPQEDESLFPDEPVDDLVDVGDHDEPASFAEEQPA